MTTAFTTHCEKKPVLVRVPQDLYSRLLRMAASETLLRNRTVSVPALMCEIVIAALEKAETSGESCLRRGE